MMQAISPGLLKEADAARWLGICPRTLRKLRQDGHIHYILIRTSIRYSLDDLQTYVERARQCPSINEKALPTGGIASPSPTVADFEEARKRRKSGKLG
ncbi:helix-turn-helix domain-containing protein [Sphingobium abikonense]|uniref:helix-turn-helix domain-containing protein n=1 Tax=Sphingobium abikonense TaxID=86193 RepID=UPI002E8BE430|nr:helix-turn-helix domain-containing protein [Pseudomonadota bacterium]